MSAPTGKDSRRRAARAKRATGPVVSPDMFEQMTDDEQIAENARGAASWPDQGGR
jgi:hypothetical protein